MSRAGGGEGGTSAYNSNAVTLQSGTSSATGVDPYIEVEYTSASASGTTVTTTTTVTGAQSRSLRLERDTVGIHTVQCEISHPTAVNNPASSSTRENSVIMTDKVEFSALSAVNLTRSNLTYEITRDSSDGNHKVETVNLFVQPMTLAGTITNNNTTRNIHVYPPEEDITVKITMLASAGESFNGNTGGQGGMTIFTYTLLKNTEYTFKLGCTKNPTGSIGLGGAGAYFYEGGRLLVACGGGGASGWESGSNGGAGGGAGVPGRAGNGRSGGEGGIQVNTGELSSEGSHNIGRAANVRSSGGTPGGKVESCTTGIYWRNQGISPCEFMGNGRYRNSDGQEIFNTSDQVNRGYKADDEDYGYRHNGGNSTIQINGRFVGGGGAGAYGGAATGSLTSGGGGASGYTNGSVNLLFAQVGGNRDLESSALIELLTSDNDKMTFLVRGG